MVPFADAEKIAAFDALAPYFTAHNFGVAGKSDIELVFFSIVMTHQQHIGGRTDDYTLSNLLGITQSRVHNLKIKAQLRNPASYDWQSEFRHLAKNARSTDNDRYVTTNCDNPILQIEIQHFIEIRGGFVEYSLNGKLLKKPIDNFAMLMIEIGIDKDEKAVCQFLRQKHLIETDLVADVDKQRLKTRLLNAGGTVLKELILGLLP